jgi:hypothetical protein
MQLQHTPASVSVLNPEYAVFGIIILAHQRLPTHWIYNYQNLTISLHLNYISLRVTANAIMHVLFKRWADAPRELKLARGLGTAGNYI